MATNGNNGMGEGFKEILAFGGAEVVSVGAALFTYAVADDLIPGLMKSGSKVLAKCIEPFQDTIEKAMARCNSKDCKVNWDKSRQERREDYAHYALRFGLSATVSLGTEWLARKGFNKLLKTKEPASNLVVTGLDKGLHLGGIIVGNTIFAKQTDQLISGTSSMLQKTTNMSKDHADKTAEGAWRWELANVFSAVSTCGYLLWRQLSKHGGKNI